VQIYLDICCLKRPFDDQAQPRIFVTSDDRLVATARRTHPLVRVPVRALLEAAQEVLR
jgi:hypothetical protein